MNHELTAMIAAPGVLLPALNRLPEARVVELEAGLAMLPLTQGLLREIMAMHGETYVKPMRGFKRLTRAVAALAAELSSNGALLYIEEESDRGPVWHAAVAWRYGSVSFGPRFTQTDDGLGPGDEYVTTHRSEENAINAGLRELGVQADPRAEDEERTVGLRRFRRTEDWYDANLGPPLPYRKVAGKGLFTRYDDAPTVVMHNRPNEGGSDLQLEFYSRSARPGERDRRTRITFEDVMEFRWVVTDFVYYTTDLGSHAFALIEVLDSELKQRLIDHSKYRTLPPGDRLGGVIKEDHVKHYRIGFDDHGAYEVLCIGLRIDHIEATRVTASDYSFEMCDEAELYCERIVDDMVRFFSIDRREAISRVNRHWRGMSFVSAADYHLLTHQTTSDWAYDIYYGKQSMWWQPGASPQPLPRPEDA